MFWPNLSSRDREGFNGRALDERARFDGHALADRPARAPAGDIKWKGGKRVKPILLHHFSYSFCLLFLFILGREIE